MRHIPLVVTNTNKRAMDIDVHYRQILNQKLGPVNDRNNGWFAGGSYENAPVGIALQQVDRITFANDLATSQLRGNLTGARFYFSGTGNSTDGWLGGGVNGPIFSSPLLQRVDRITFSTDGSTALLRASLSSSRWGNSSVGNNTDGWYVGGVFNFNDGALASTVDRVIFSADLSTASVRNPLPQARFGQGVASNNQAGWIISGVTTQAPIARISQVVRITFINDTSTHSTRGNVSAQIEYPTSLWNATDGWFSGGDTGVGGPGSGSTVIQRIIFASDTSLTTVRGSLLSPRFAGGNGQQNTSDGWIGGGVQISGASGNQSTATLNSVEKMTFSNDTTTVRRGSITTYRLGPAGP